MTEVSLVLAVYMISTALVYSGGPYGALERLREQEWMKDLGLLDCFLCTSFWVSMIVLFVPDIHDGFVFVAWGVSYLADKIITTWMLK